MGQNLLREVRRPRLATDSSDSSKVQRAFQDMTSLMTAVVRKHHRTKLSLYLHRGDEDPDVLEQADKICWIHLLVQFIVNADLPAVYLMPEGTEADGPRP